ncbi:MAG: choice-of-anchor tandem repeat GloVer-containing protein [Capsulimonadaceae bacterium]
MHTHTTPTSRVRPRCFMLRGHHIRQVLYALISALVTVTILFSSSGAAALPGALAITTSRELASATRIGPTAASKMVTLSLVLPLRNPDQLKTLLGRLYDPADPLFHHFLTSDQFTSRFGPAPDRVAAVEAAAQVEGLQVLDVTPNNMIIHVQAPASTVNSVFHVILSDYVGSDGVPFISCGAAPVLPLALAQMQVSVVGLDGSLRLHHDMHVVGRRAVDSGSTSETPSPLTGRAGEGASSVHARATDSGDESVNPSPKSLKYYSGFGLLPSDVYSLYNWSMPSTGAGQNVALFELATWTPNDISDWESSVLLGASTLTPQAVAVDGVSLDPLTEGSVEVTLDIDMVLLMAPGISNLYVYEAPIDGDNAQETLDIYTKMATDNTARVISTSWGFSEDDWTPYEDQYVIDEGQIFEEFAAQGQTLCVAAGDGGAYDDGGSIPNVGLEAAMPYVLSVGGTDLTDGPGETYISESSWADPSDTGRGVMGTGGGGGISGYWPIPAFQIGAFNPLVNLEGSLSNRNVPDVSLFADYDDNGYEILWTDVCGAIGPAGTQYEVDVNGTSAAAPLWGGLLAAVNAGRASAGESGLGFADPAIYTLAEEPAAYANDFHDIDDGSNNLYYRAVTGYDNSTGWGSFQGDNIFSDLLTYGTGAPRTPAGLTATPGYEEIALSWNACTWATSYNVYRGTTSGGEGATPIATATAATFADTGLPNGTTFYYEVKAVNASGQSGRSAEVSATPGSAIPPLAPAGLVAASDVAQVLLTWTASAGATGYDVYRGTAVGAETEIVNNVTAATYPDTGLANGVTYYYYVTAENANGASAQSNTASATPEPLPTVPTTLSATTSSGAMLLSWSGVSDATSFNIYEGTASGCENAAPVASTWQNTILITGLTNLKTYYFRVAGVNASGTGVMSNEASGEPMLETILHRFDPNIEGFAPTGLIQGSNGDFYGMTGFGSYGEPDFYGTLFGINTAGDVTVVYDFLVGAPLYYWSGAVGDLVLGTDGNFYGVGNGGSTLGYGVNDAGFGDIFRVTPAGSETILHNFSDGTVPGDGWGLVSGLVLASDGNFYGTTVFGGSTTGIGPSGWGYGTLFRITPSGEYTILHNFGDGSVVNDGQCPYAALIQGSDGALYGTTLIGGSTTGQGFHGFGYGTVFRITTAGVETVLHNFGDGTTPNDAGNPDAPLLQGNDGNFYGTTLDYGPSNGGTIFRMDASGNMTVLHEFGDGTVAFDGSMPQAALIQATDGNFYGTAGGGGYSGGGTVFRMDSSGHVTILHAFLDGSVFEDGALPWQPLIQGADGALYSTTDAVFGGFSGFGTSFFRIDADLNSKPIPASPTGLTATAGNGLASLFWAASTGATSYNVYRATASGAEGSVPVGTTGIPTYTDTGLTDGVMYFYTVAAVTASGTSPLSNEASARPVSSILPAPTGLAATAGNASAVLSWTSRTGATSYNVYRATASGFEGTTAVGTSTGGSFNDSGLTNGVTYFYTVAAIDAAGTSPQSSEASVTPSASILAAPASLTASAGNALVSLSWTASTGATAYRVYRATTSGAEGTAAAATVIATSYTDTGLTNGVTYYYKVAAVNSAETSRSSNEAAATPKLSAPTAPSGLTATAGNAAVSLFWTASDSATSYAVYRGTATGAEGSASVGAAVLPTYTDTGLANNVTYFYTVTAVNGAGTSTHSNESSAAPVSTALPAPSGLAATAGNAQVSLSWNAIAVATSYLVYRATASGNEGTNPVGSSSTTSYVDTGLTGGGTYYYTVTACNSVGVSLQSNEASATPVLLIPSAPAGLTATSSSSGVLLEWTGSGSAASFNVYGGTAPGAEASSPVTTSSGRSALVTGLTNQLTYYFKVAGVNSVGTGPMSNEASNHPIGETILHAFGDGSVIPDGASPNGGFIEAANGDFYGTTRVGGSANYGTVFQVAPSGIVTILHSFGDGTVASDGIFPNPSLILATDGNFYGTTAAGGSTGGISGVGTVFRMTPSGIVTIIHNFGDGTVPNDGRYPLDCLVQASDGNLYGTTEAGGTEQAGAVFRITLSGTESVLYSFGTIANDGAVPNAGLIQANDGTLYGTTEWGGPNGWGTAFSITTSGVYALLHSFGGTPDGALPGAALVQGLDGDFYGTTVMGGSTNVGTAFKMDASGNVAILHNFDDGTVPLDGQYPATSLIQATDGSFYGITLQGGSNFGTAYRMDSSGDVTILHAFADGSVTEDGKYSYNASSNSPTSIGPLLQGFDGALYGAAMDGGTGSGTMFKLDAGLAALPTQAPPAPANLVATSGDESVILTWMGSASAQSYNVYEGTVAGGEGAAPILTGLSGVSTSVQGLTNGTTYYFTLTATNKGGTSPPSNEASATPMPVVAPTPTGFVAASSSGAILLNWNLSVGATSYNIYEGTASGGETAAAVKSTVWPPALVTGLTNGRTYFLKIAAVSPAGTSPLSSEASAVPVLETIEHNFGDGTVTNDGLSPDAALTPATGGAYYGVTEFGGVANEGAVYQVDLVGNETILHSFGDGTVAYDGVFPNGVILASDGNLYGTTCGGGTTGYGTVFRMTLAGDETILHSFGDGSVANDGGYPVAAMMQARDGNLYGTTSGGGLAGAGTVFRVTLSGATTILHSFADGSVTNDGIYPVAPLIEASDGNLYGTTPYGGKSATAGNAGDGTVFRMSTSGDEVVLHSFNDGTVTNDGAAPAAALLQGTDGDFYGTTYAGGSRGFGAVFRMDASGNVTIVHNFEDGTVPFDGALPWCALIQATDGNFYGTAEDTLFGYYNYFGVVFRMDSAGNVTTLHVFSDGSVSNDGFDPFQSLIQGQNGALYGITFDGGDAGDGTIFRVDARIVPPAPTGLTATAGNAQVSLTWTGSTGATSYSVYRGTVSGGEASTPIGTATSTAFTDTGATNGVKYFYTAAAVDSAGTSALSSEASATPEPPIPATPSGLTATAGNAQVALSWTASTGATSYSVYRGTASGGEASTPIGTATSTAFTDTGVTNGVKYFYTVAAVDAAGTSAHSNEASTTLAPNAPTRVTATAGNAQVGLSWTSSYAATTYAIYRGTTSGGESSTPVASTTGLSYTNTGLTNGTKYYYKVAAVNAGGTGVLSTEVSATPEPPVPVAPAGLTATPGNARVTLSWIASTGATSYNVYRGTTSGGEASTAIGTATTATSYTDTGLTNFVTYYYKVAAVNGGGISALSNEASATPTPPLSPTHLLWSTGNGSLALWNYNPVAGTYTQNVYGPYPGWTAQAIADGPDGMTRVLWVSTTGAAAIWSVNGSTGLYTQNTFGPYPGWTAGAVSVSPSNVTHILWSTSGSASIWNYNTGNGIYTQDVVGSYPGWTAKAIADGPDGLTRVLWVNASGMTSIWSLNPISGAFSQYSFGPYPGWTAAALSVNAANTTHVLWTNVSKVAALWNYNTTTGEFTQNDYGVFPGWTAASITDGPDGNTQLLWESTTGACSIWDLNNTTGAFTQNSFGPFPAWTATAVSAYP